MGALTSERLRHMLRRAADEFEWIVIDTPPVELLPDAKILAGLADGAVLVVEAGSTRCQLAQRAIEAIGRERVVGAVLNQFSDGSDLHRYYGYFGDSRERPAGRRKY
jgi:Mrp family chromosome partitioning ATPase